MPVNGIVKCFAERDSASGGVPAVGVKGGFGLARTPPPDGGAGRDSGWRSSFSADGRIPCRRQAVMFLRGSAESSQSAAGRGTGANVIVEQRELTFSF